MSKNILNKSKTTKTPKLSHTKSLENEKQIYQVLKPLVNDFTKPCKTKRGSSKPKEVIKTEELQEIKLKFIQPKENVVGDFLINNVSENLRCVICKGLFNNPVACYKCSQPFCSECIKTCLDKNTKCPQCFNIIFMDLMPKFNHVDQYNKFEIGCPYQGCKDRFNLNEIKAHIDMCVFKESTPAKRESMNKLFRTADKKDPYMKNHVMNYLIAVNQSVSNFLNTEPSLVTSNDNVKSVTISITNDKAAAHLNNELDFFPKLSDLKGQLGYVNDYISKTIIDLARSTKATNEKLKNIINS